MDLLFCNEASTNFLLILLLITSLKASYCIIIDYSQTFDNINATYPVVRIPHGEVRGIHMETHHGRKVFGFKGIPFAKPPLGNLRFRAPVPAEPWNGTLDASKESNPCTQFWRSTVLGNEDCLYLSVYTPQLRESENTTLLPVMVYIYGGGFNSGSTSSERYGPYFLLDKDVILVVPSYRLSVLGFLSTGDDVCPGNYGLKDIVQALKWCQDNIRYFGGDPNQVTLAGGSSGAMTVELLTLSDLTTAMLESYYLTDLTANTNLLLDNITQLASDGLFQYPVHRSMQFHLQHKKSPQYLCSFEYRGQLSYSQALTKTRVDWGSVHGDESVYLFQRSTGYGFPDLEMDETDWKMVDLMVQLWVSFATNGTLTSTNSNGTTIFESYSLRKRHIRIGFNSEVSLGVGYNFFEDRAKFWDELTANTTWK